jgi:hypothetical protein
MDSMTSYLAEELRASHRHGASQPYYRLDGHFTNIEPIGPVAEGLRMNGHFAGSITAGELFGASVVGVDYFRIRSDGVGVVTAHEVVTSGDRKVAVEVRGYTLPPQGQPAPTIEEILQPGFAWPEQPYLIRAFATFSTAAPDLQHLNRTVVAHTGTVNFSTGELVVEAELVR